MLHFIHLWVQSALIGKNPQSCSVSLIMIDDNPFQVLALYRDQYTAAKSAASRMLSSGATSASDLGRFYESHLAPWLVRETGKVRVASGDKASLSKILLHSDCRKIARNKSSKTTYEFYPKLTSEISHNRLQRQSPRTTS